MTPKIATITGRLRSSGSVFAEEEARVLVAGASSDAELAHMVEQRVDGLPIEHILGWAEFDGLRVAVGEGVFVPRYRTQFLVARAAKLTPPGATVVDLCCGSGALGLALATKVARIRLHAADIDPGEVACARRNLAAVGGRVYEGDLFEALPPGLRGRVTTLLANVPYVPTEDIALMPPEARDYEPRVALDGGPDGLDVLRRVAAGAPEWLAPGGHLLVETSVRQAEAAAAIIEGSGLSAHVASSKKFGATIMIGTLL